MDRKFKKQRKYLKAQGVLEFSAAFIAVIFLLFSIVDCASFYQTFHSTQTFSDEVDFNLAPFGADNICVLPDSEILEIVQSRADKYLQRDLSLNIKEHSDKHLLIESNEDYLGNNILTVRVSCKPSYESISVRANYLYRGFFIFRGGKIISTISSVQTPKF